MRCEEHSTVNDVMVDAHMCASELLENCICVYPHCFLSLLLFGREAFFNDTTLHLFVGL